jgi:hypothetical protein
LFTKCFDTYVDTLRFLLTPATKLAVFTVTDCHNIRSAVVAATFQQTPELDISSPILVEVIRELSEKCLVVDSCAFDGASHKLIKNMLVPTRVTSKPTLVSQVK